MAPDLSLPKLWWLLFRKCSNSSSEGGESEVGDIANASTGGVVDNYDSDTSLMLSFDLAAKNMPLIRDLENILLSA